MIEFIQHQSDSNQSVFVFSGDTQQLYHSGSLEEHAIDNVLIEIYDNTRSPNRILCEIILNKSKKGVGKLYNCDKNSIQDIHKNMSITWENANYIYDRNRWLLGFTSSNKHKIMRIDDEYDTYDGQFLYHDRIFENNKLVEIKHFTKNHNN